MKLVPHAFVDYIDLEEDFTYSYSLNHNKKTASNALEPTVIFILDYAPVKMILTRKKRETGDFLIACCSIVGGVFIIYGLLNSFLVRCFEKCK